MDEKQSFIIQDLDDNHILIKADEEERVRRELDAEVYLETTICLRYPHRGYSLREIRIVWTHDRHVDY